MKRICSWCNKEMNSGPEVLSGLDHIITHGICEACAAEVLADLEAFDFVRPNQPPRDCTLVDTYTGKDPRLAAFASGRKVKLSR